MIEDDIPMTPIGVAAGLVGVHPETLRIWERNGLVTPTRRNRLRLYSANDLRRLRFIHYLMSQKGLNIAGVKHVLTMYPCWSMKGCRGGNPADKARRRGKACWKVEGTYCLVAVDKADQCCACEIRAAAESEQVGPGT